MRVCLGANTLRYPHGGGHLWVYLNWALGLRASGYQVVWLEVVTRDIPSQRIQSNITCLKERLRRYGFGDDIVLCAGCGVRLSPEIAANGPEPGADFEADLLLNFQRDIPPDIIARFRRSAFVDIDPGLLQIWVNRGEATLPSHDVYFTIGETVGMDERIPDLGLSWRYTPPCIALDWWARHDAEPDAAFTTVAHWFASALTDEDNKRSGFQPFLNLPQHVPQPLELAIDLGGDDEDWGIPERMSLQKLGWRVRYAPSVASTPWDYQEYIQTSRGEFSCAKPACIQLQNAWISDRTLCYLASGKPAVVQHTGLSRFLPEAAGLFRFRDFREAVRSFEAIAVDYQYQCGLARALAEEHFDARKIVASVLERALN